MIIHIKRKVISDQKKETTTKKANKKILLAHKRIQKAYEVIDEIKQKDEKKIIHCLFQDLSDKLLDNV